MRKQKEIIMILSREESDTPEYEEYHKAIQKLKNLKTPGEDAITANNKIREEGLPQNDI